MVIVLMFLGAICVFLSVMLTKTSAMRILLTSISAVIFVGSTCLMTGNYNRHWGMHQVTTTKTQQIYSASNSSMPLALYQPVGKSGEDDVYIYNTKAHQKKPNHTQANEYTHNHLQWTNGTQAQLVTKETRWRFDNSFTRLLYAWTGMDGKLIKRTNTFKYPKVYVKVSTKQAKRLAQSAKSTAGRQAQAAARQRAKTYVSAKVKAAMAKNPKMSSQQIQKVTQQAEMQFQSKMIKQMLK